MDGFFTFFDSTWNVVVILTPDSETIRLFRDPKKPKETEIIFKAKGPLLSVIALGVELSEIATEIRFTTPVGNLDIAIETTSLSSTTLTVDLLNSTTPVGNIQFTPTP